MINQTELEEMLVAGLRYYLNTGEPPPPNQGPEDWPPFKKEGLCEVVRQDQTGYTPDYPYVCYKTSALLEEKGGTYAEDPETGVFFMPVTQKWGFSVQSDSEAEAVTTAMMARDFLRVAGHIWFYDHGAAVQSVGDLRNRADLVSHGYQYLVELEATLALMDRIDTTRGGMAGEIDAAVLGHKEGG